MSKISLTLSSSPSNKLLCKLAGNLALSEPIPDILDEEAEEFLPSPLDVNLVLSLGFQGGNLVGTATITDYLSALGIPANCSIELCNVQLGFLGSLIAKARIGSGISETLSAVLALEA